MVLIIGFVLLTESIDEEFTKNESESKKSGYMYMQNWFTWSYTWN